jgi:phage tail sheath protein FI
MGVTGHERIFVPPSGHIAGIYVRSDNTRGVHKAPANELVMGAVSLERRLDDTEHGDLNAVGINVIRMVAGKAQPIVWGARTTARQEETPWRYVNVRRLFIYVEESIQKGISWAVLEPNGPALWSKLHRTITEFLTRVWRSGALLADTREEAFYVRIDEEVNAESERALGRVMIEIGIAPLRPAEFVVVRIGQWTVGER